MDDAAKRNIFVIGLNDFNRAKLERIHGAERYAYHGLLKPEEILDAEEFPIAEMLERAERQLLRADRVDAIVGYMDFPVSTMLPILARRFGVRALSLESLLKCEHKYWSRLEQSRVVPEHVPRFVAFDPFAEDPLAQIDLPMPFWVKPVKSAGSWLGFRISSRAELDAALEVIRANIGRFGDPFNRILEHAELPPEVARVDGNHCLAEEIIGGRQCTLEGYVQNGRVQIHGVIDSVRDPNGSTFSRYQYPSQLPRRITRQMHAITERFLGHVGFDDSAFNVEFFWRPSTDRIWLLEVNTRVAQHHSDLFEKVDGVSNHEVMVDVALGQPPRMLRRQGPFRAAGCFFLRHYRDAVVTRVPGEAELAEVERLFPGTIVEPHVEEGTVLSELPDQDSYSYVLAIIYLGAPSARELMSRYRACLAALDFRLRDREPDAA